MQTLGDATLGILGPSQKQMSHLTMIHTPFVLCISHRFAPVLSSLSALSAAQGTW